MAPLRLANGRSLTQDLVDLSLRDCTGADRQAEDAHRDPRLHGVRPRPQARAARSFCENCCKAAMPLASARWHQACRSAASCSREEEVLIQSWRNSSRMVTILSSTGCSARARANCGRAEAGLRPYRTRRPED